MMMQNSMINRGPTILLFAILALSVLLDVVSGVPAGSNSPLLSIERIGVPYPSWTSPAHGFNATEFNLNPHLTRSSHLSPRFHRMLRYGQDKSAKTQTAIFVTGRTSSDEENGRPGASILSALNPRDGGIVWRTVRNDTDPVHSIHLSSDVMVTISGLDETRVSLSHALTGYTLWSGKITSATDAAFTGLVDAAIIPPAYLQPLESASVAALAPDVIAMDRAGSLVRFAGVNGAVMWKADSISIKGTEPENKQIIPIKLHSDKKHVIIVSLVQSSSKGLLSSSVSHSLRVNVYQAYTGAPITSFDVPGSNVEMASTMSDRDTTGNVVVVGRNAEGDFGRNPHLVWLQTDGTIKSFDIPLPAEKSDIQIESSSIKTLKPKQANRFNALSELAILNNRGILIARTNNARAEALRIGKKEKHLISFWEMEEEAWDSVYTGSVDKQGNPYLNRVFFGRSQHLLNFHTLWADRYEEQGQVTGASFQWDHDLNGDVLAAPFEVSPVADYQLMWRSAFVTGSSSIRMLQDEKHEWMREEGLSHTTASIMIDLPESKLSAGHGSETRAILEGEGFVHRLERHFIALQNLPAWTTATILKLAEEIPKLSLESFGIIPPKKVEHKGVPQKQPVPTGAQGAAPLRGVGAQKLGSKGSKPQKGRPDVPQPRHRTTTKQVEPQGPPPPAHVAPREANSTITNHLVRDAFGFRKLIISTSKSGKIYAIDSQTGKYIWEKSLFGFGQGEGSPVPTVDVKLLALVRPIAGSGADISSPIGQQTSNENVTSHAATSQLDFNGLITIVAEVEDEGAIFTRMWEIEPLTGRFPGGKETQTGIALFPGKAKDVFLLPIEDEKSGQIAAVAISDRNKIMVWPTTSSIQDRFVEIGSNFFYAVAEKSSSDGRHALAGYTPISRGELVGEKAWQLPLPAEEEIVSITRAIQDPVASQGKVLGDRRTLYKYLNPHLLLAITRNQLTRSSNAYLVDGVNGKIVHQSILAAGNLALNDEDGTPLKPIAVLTENWATITFAVDIPAEDPQARYKGPHRQTRLVSIELYQPLSDDEEIWNWRGVFSSFASYTKQSKSLNGRTKEVAVDKPVNVFSQLYILPYGVRAVAATRTKLGISSKALVLATDQNRLQILPRRMLDPRRPLGRKPTQHEMEEGLITYDPNLMDTGKFHLGGRQVPLPRRIHIKPSQLESTSVVFVDQALDYFIATVAPSGSFDLLSESFNKLQLLLTIAVLTIGLFVTKPMVASKMLRMRW
ncbi:hypothetical protein L7F22_019565 [Adiantum nelumboides]|nr:hypothetical protein [Adiantum nelumboides]